MASSKPSPYEISYGLIQTKLRQSLSEETLRLHSTTAAEATAMVTGVAAKMPARDAPSLSLATSDGLVGCNS